MTLDQPLRLNARGLYTLGRPLDAVDHPLKQVIAQKRLHAEFDAHDPPKAHSARHGAPAKQTRELSYSIPWAVNVYRLAQHRQQI